MDIKALRSILSAVRRCEAERRMVIFGSLAQPQPPLLMRCLHRTMMPLRNTA